MSESKNRRKTNKNKPTRKSLTTLAQAAFIQAAEQLIERAEQSGTSIVIWEDGGIKELDPAEARKRLAERRKKRHRKS